MSKPDESHKQALDKLIEHYIGSMKGPIYKERLVEEILRLHDRFASLPKQLDETGERKP